MERRERRQFGQRVTHVRRDPDRLRETRAAMYDAMHDGFYRGDAPAILRNRARLRDDPFDRGGAALAGRQVDRPLKPDVVVVLIQGIDRSRADLP